MRGSVTRRAIFAFAFAFGAAAQIAKSTISPTKQTIESCVGDHVVFHWKYTVDENESLEGIKWYYTDSKSDQPLAEFSTSDGFVVQTAYQSRLSFSQGDASLVLSQVTTSDKGNYSVEVRVRHSSGALFKHHSTSELQVLVPPKTVGGSLVISQSRVAAHDDNGDLHADVMCGPFTDLGDPPVHVVWKTPSSFALIGTNKYDGSHFHLALDNPVTGGDYTCRLSPSSPAAGCLQSDDPLLREATLNVDEVKGRLTLIESQLQTTHEREDGLIKEIQRRKVENVELRKENGLLLSRMDNLERYVLSVEALLTQYQRDNLHLSSSVQSMTSELKKIQDAANVQVSFHAKMTNETAATPGQHLILKTVLNNEGGAYNSTSGNFTAPVNGTYFFIVTSGPCMGHQYVDMYLMVGEREVCYTQSKWGNIVEMETCHTAQHLAKGQSVWVRNGNETYDWFGGAYFTGVLVNAD